MLFHESLIVPIVFGVCQQAWAKAIVIVAFSTLRQLAVIGLGHLTGIVISYFRHIPLNKFNKTCRMCLGGVQLHKMHCVWEFGN
jgi:hypothetical protein